MLDTNAHTDTLVCACVIETHISKLRTQLTCIPEKSTIVMNTYYCAKGNYFRKQKEMKNLQFQHSSNVNHNGIWE